MMLRCFVTASRLFRPATSTYSSAARIICTDFKGFSTLNSCCKPGPSRLLYHPTSLSENKYILDISNNFSKNPVRTVTKFSLKKGKRKTVKTVLKRFFRLDWGAWIRPKVGRKKKLWKKSSAQRRRLRQHVFCNGTQTALLDKMVTKFWKRPKYYVDDPYQPYHTREEFWITRKNPASRD